MGANADGGDRIAALALDLRRPSPVDERTGLIRWVFDLPMEPGEPRVFNCSARLADTTRYTSAPVYDDNGGAGLTRAAARGAAIGEAMERYCAGLYRAEDLVFGSARDLGCDYPISAPDSYALFHPDQDASYPPFTDDVPLAWTWGFSLVRREPLLVPACLVYMPYTPSFRELGERAVAGAVSTGLACGRSRDDSLLRGLCEVVERDAFVITWLNRLTMPRVDIGTSAPLIRLYSDRLQRDGLAYVLIDTTTDLPIPSFLCVLIDESTSPPMISTGGASAVDPVQAATKALIEAVQTREWARFLGRMGKKRTFASDFSDVRSFEDHVVLYAYGDMVSALAFLLNGQLVSLRDGDAITTAEEDAGDLESVVALLGTRGLDVIAVDLTAPDVDQSGYCVTKVLVPGLQPLEGDHMQRFLGGSRLYEVPVELRLRANAASLEDLNPYPHPYP